MVFQKTGNAWLVSRMDVIGITNEITGLFGKGGEGTAILRVLVFGLSMPGDLTRLVSGLFPFSHFRDETDKRELGQPY